MGSSRAHGGWLIAAVAASVVLAACSGPTARPAAGRSTPPAGTSTPSAGGSTPSASGSTPSAGAPTPGTPPPATPTAAPFVGEAATVTAADLPTSWRVGCPVGPQALTLVRLSYWDFDGRPQIGRLVVNRALTADVIRIFGTLYRLRFPIRRMQPVEAYGGSDAASMTADNTSGFNCRRAVASGPPRWSEHAYGRAIDVNPVENPYLLGGSVLPSAGAAYLDRGNVRPGMAVRGGTLVEAFASAGWRWGGRWRSTPDYQHFSKTA